MKGETMDDEKKNCCCEEGGECSCGDEHECRCVGEEREQCCGGAEGGRCGCGDHKKANADGEEFDYESHDAPLPKPNLVMLVSSLAQQAMVSMGVLPNPMTGRSVFLFNQATHLIDTIDLIFEKTTGNRTEEETRTLENVLSELRMLYVSAVNEKKRRDAEKKA